MRLLVFASVMAFLVLLVGCAERGDSKANHNELFPIVFQLDWVPEPQHGGLYMAQALGFFEEAGLEVELVPGGPNANVRLRVGTNRAQFGQVEGNNALLAIAEGVPLRIVAALFQHDPSTFLYHADRQIDSFADLEGQRLKARPNWAFLTYLKKTKGISFEVTPIDFGLEVFAADPEVIQQGYYIAEPYYLAQQEIEVRWLHVWDAGYDGLSAIVSNPDFLETHPAQAKAFLEAYYRGQQAYFEGDPSAAHALILAANPNASEAFLMWSREQIIAQKLAEGDPLRGGSGEYLVVSPQRIARQIDQLEVVEALAHDTLGVADAFDGRFLPTGTEPTQVGLALQP